MSKAPSVALLVGAVLLGVACGIAAQPRAPSSPAMEKGEPVYGGVFKQRHDEDVEDWDMASTGQSYSEYSERVYERPVRFKAGPGIGYYEQTLEPRLAERWEVSPDATTFTFHLRKGVKFANLPPVNGRELTSADVKFSYEYLGRVGEFKGLKASTVGFMYEGIEAIDTPDRYTVAVRFKVPFAPFINYAGSIYNPIMPREIYDADGHFKDRAVGTGPFQLDKAASQKNARWVFKKNQAYWDTGKPYLDEVQHLVINDEGTSNAAFQTKQVDSRRVVPDPIQAAELARVPGVISFEFPASFVHAYMQNERPPFNDERVRKAFSMALNRDEFIKLMAGGKGQWVLTGDRFGLFTEAETKQILRYDPTEAKRLLAEAGYSQGVQVPYLLSIENQQQVTWFELMQSQLKQVGINLVAERVTQAEWSRRPKDGADFVLRVSGKKGQADIDGDLFGLFHSSQPGINYGRVNDPKVDQLTLAQRREPDPVKRRALVREAIKYINERAFATALYKPVNWAFWHGYVKDYHLNYGIGNGNQSDLLSVWLDAR